MRVTTTDKSGVLLPRDGGMALTISTAKDPQIVRGAIDGDIRLVPGPALCLEWAPTLKGYVPALRSIDRFKIRDKTVFTVPAPFEMDRENPEIIGRRVLLDGLLCKVVGVEHFMTRPPIRPGEPIGILVETD